MSECLTDSDGDPQQIYKGIELVLGGRRGMSRVKMLAELVELSVERKATDGIEFLSLMEKAGEEGDHAKAILAKSFKKMENVAKSEGGSLLKLVSPVPCEMLAYASLSKLGANTIIGLIKAGLSDHAKAMMKAWGANDPRDFRSLMVEGTSIYPIVREILYTRPLGETHRDVRELFLGQNDPGHEELYFRATAILRFVSQGKKVSLPDLVPFDDAFKVRYEALILSQIFAKVVEMNGYEMSEEYEAFFIAGLRKLSDAGLNVLSGIYTQPSYGYGVGYQYDQGGPSDPVIETRAALEVLKFGAEGMKSREKGYREIKFKMRDTVCNHLLDLLPEKKAMTLLEKDAYKLERYRFTGNHACLEGLKNRAHLDREFAADLGL